MYKEAMEAPEVVARQIENNRAIMQTLGREFQANDPYSLVTVARGSSDHAAQYLNYLAGLLLGKLSTSLSLSLITIYQKAINVERSLAVAISQSGESPDLIEPMKSFKEKAHSSVALVNAVDSPLARVVKWVVPLQAGEEKSVAATKSFIASLTASASLIASMGKLRELQNGLLELPENMKKAQDLDWSKAISKFSKAKRIMVVGRGLGLPLALEAALKFKETCSIQAEAFSSAEIKHGPQTLIQKGYPLLIFANRGPGLADLLVFAKEMRARKAQVVLVAPKEVREKDLIFPETDHPELDVICAIQAFYLMVEELSQELGHNPDRPKNLSKVTRTK
ncbi:MAG: iron dicitrate transport regulator FecR [Bdellovibrionales bacterium GWA2_49_15]|nr:MAG: iron dicitrate transport regulator FecR [Bdellovibrionales bacterium GWA2_49_15]HAZ11603.1 iron dicitrate transport regulator FecR [Bdellovibrionales bacterium]